MDSLCFLLCCSIYRSLLISYLKISIRVVEGFDCWDLEKPKKIFLTTMPINPKAEDWSEMDGIWGKRSNFYFSCYQTPSCLVLEEDSVLLFRINLDLNLNLLMSASRFFFCLFNYVLIFSLIYASFYYITEVVWTVFFLSHNRNCKLLFLFVYLAITIM